MSVCDWQPMTPAGEGVGVRHEQQLGLVKPFS
jgi:hypothetical protein